MSTKEETIASNEINFFLFFGATEREAELSGCDYNLVFFKDLQPQSKNNPSAGFR